MDVSLFRYANLSIQTTWEKNKASNSWVQKKNIMQSLSVDRGFWTYKKDCVDTIQCLVEGVVMFL